MKGYDYLKKALDGELKPKTIIKTRHEITDEDLGKVIDTYDYYIYQNDNMFHRCNKDGKLGAKYQDRFLNYKVLEKDFEFYCVLEEEKKIPEKLSNIKFENGKFYLPVGNKHKYIIREVDKVFLDKINEIINYLDYFKSKGDE